VRSDFVYTSAAFTAVV